MVPAAVGGERAIAPGFSRVLIILRRLRRLLSAEAEFAA